MATPVLPTRVAEHAAHPSSGGDCSVSAAPAPASPQPTAEPRQGRLVITRVPDHHLLGTMLIEHGGEQLVVRVRTSDRPGRVQLVCEGPHSFTILRLEVLLDMQKQGAYAASRQAALTAAPTDHGEGGGE